MLHSRFRFRLTVIVPAVAALAACGGSSGDPIRRPGQNIAAFNTLANTIDATAFTPAFDVENGMNIAYDGFARIRLIEGGTETSVLHGAAEFSVNVDDSDIEISGRIGDFSDNTALYDGVILVTPGGSNREPGGNFSFPDLSGTLTRDTGETIPVSAGTNLRFYGPQGEFLQGGAGFQFLRNGAPFEGILTINAQTD